MRHEACDMVDAADLSALSCFLGMCGIASGFGLCRLMAYLVLVA